MYRCGLLGRNIGYSRSPEIHNEYYRFLQVPITYELFDIQAQQLNEFINSLHKENIIGFNVTIPYKEAIINYIDKLEYPADKINAVNTVLVREGNLVGYNTDYFGFLNSLKNLNVDLRNKNALILGKGGSAKSVYRALLDLECSVIDIGCRSIKNVDNYFTGANKILELKEVKNLRIYDIIVNCTPAGSLNYPNECPIELAEIKNNTIVYDLIYRPKSTILLKKAAKLDAITINGESMLNQQAIMSADIWINYLKERI